MKRKFRESKYNAIKYLRENRYDAEARELQDEKNLLASGVVTNDRVEGLLQRCTGDKSHYEEQTHHQLGCPLYIFKPSDVDGERWYIKLYFVEDTLDNGEVLQENDAALMFISVHRSEH
jgi:hypothetical protein